MYQLIQNSHPYYHYKKAKSKTVKGTILFIHGYAVQSNYHNYFSDLVDDYNYLAVEHAGHGITPLTSKQQLKPTQFAADVCQLIKTLDLHDIYLIGHSMGGGIAMMVANQMPERIKKMVIVTPMNSRGVKKVFNFLFYFQPKTLDAIKKFYDIIMYDYANNKHKLSNKEIEDVIALQTKYEKNFNTLKRNMISLKNHLALRKAEKNIRVPTLLMVGKHDGCIDAKMTIRNIKNRMKHQSELLSIYQFEHAGHIPFLEQTDLYYQIIMDFFKE